MDKCTNELEAARAERHRMVDAAADALRAGKLVALPTETVYGLGADATNDEAVAAIFEAKGRPRFNPLIVHVLDVEQGRKYGEFNRLALKLAEAFLPGALTLIVPRVEGCGISHLATAGLDTVALRMPAHPVARALLRAAGVPLAAPSANKSGKVSPTTADHVRDQLGGEVAIILDGGPCSVGIESTIVACIGDDPVLLRPGGISREESKPRSGGSCGSRRRARMRRRRRRGSWRAIMRRRPGCGWRRRTCVPARRCWRSALRFPKQTGPC